VIARAIRCTAPAGAGRRPLKSIIPAIPHINLFRLVLPLPTSSQADSNQIVFFDMKFLLQMVLSPRIPAIAGSKTRRMRSNNFVTLK
jgi:hypothetical protein